MVADIDIGDFERAFGQRDARHRLFGGGGADIFGALLRQRPQFAGILEADALDQFADRKAVARHDRAELIAGRVPADMPAFEHGDAGAQPRRLQRHRQPGKAGADHADIDIEIEGQPRTLAKPGVGSSVVRGLDHATFLRKSRA